jgi:hypothetical protein
MTTTRKQLIVCGILGVLAFVPAGILAYINQPKTPILFQDEEPVAVRNAPVIDMMRFYTVPPTSTAITPKVATNFHKPTPKKQLVCGEYHEMIQGSGKVQTCEWR